MGNIFQEGADRELELVKGIYGQRGEEYRDSWHLDNINPVFTQQALEEMGLDITIEEIRLLWAATMCDVKLSRLIGPWKFDTVQDEIAYLAFFTSLMREYKKEKVDTK